MSPTRRIAVAAIVAVLIGAIAVSLHSSGGSTAPTQGNGPVEALPSPRLAGPLSLEETLAGRRSVRSFSEEALTRAEIGGLLWATRDDARPSPTALSVNRLR